MGNPHGIGLICSQLPRCPIPTETKHLLQIGYIKLTPQQAVLSGSMLQQGNPLGILPQFLFQTFNLQVPFTPCPLRILLILDISTLLLQLPHQPPHLGRPLKNLQPCSRLLSLKSPGSGNLMTAASSTISIRTHRRVWKLLWPLDYHALKFRRETGCLTWSQ